METGLGARDVRAGRPCARRWPEGSRAFPTSTTAVSSILSTSAANAGISKWILTGTRRDGQRIEVWGCDFYTFRGEKVVRKDSYWKIVE